MEFIFNVLLDIVLVLSTSLTALLQLENAVPLVAGNTYPDGAGNLLIVPFSLDDRKEQFECARLESIIFHRSAADCAVPS